MITYPLNNVLYDAEDAELFHCTRTSGVFSADDEFSASATGADNNVTIGQGIAWIRNSKFSGKVAANKASVVIDMGVADGSYARIDAIVIRFDANANQTILVAKQGVASSSPVPPAVVRTEAIYELHLYHVRRAAGSSVVSLSDITDLRADRNYCGIMMDDVTNIDENKFLAKDAYDPAGTIEAAGGFPAYLSANYVQASDKGTANGVASLDASGKVPSRQIPALSYIPTSQKEQPYGVAGLGATGDLTKHIGTSSATELAGLTLDATQVAEWEKQGGTVFVRVNLRATLTDGRVKTNFILTGLPISSPNQVVVASPRYFGVKQSSGAYYGQTNFTVYAVGESISAGGFGTRVYSDFPNGESLPAGTQIAIEAMLIIHDFS